MQSLLIIIIVIGTGCSAELPYSVIKIQRDSYISELINNEAHENEINVKTVSIDFNYNFTVNGGYFDQNNKPLGYLKINTIEIQEKVSKSLSGMLVFNKSGNIDILWAKTVKVADWDNIIQNGPFIIDPGGKNGIASNDEKIANRLCIGKYSNGDIALIYSRKITLGLGNK